MSESVTDGRFARSERSREAVAGAYAKLSATQHKLPTIEEVAGRSGLSVRSIFRLFEEPDDLLVAALESVIQISGLWERPAINGATKVGTRIDAVINSRTKGFIVLSQYRALTVASAVQCSGVSQRLAGLNRNLKVEVEDLFAPELSKRRGAARAETAAALAHSLSWPAWESMRSSGFTRTTCASSTRRISMNLLNVEV